MATSQSIRQALSTLVDDVLEAECLSNTLSGLNGDESFAAWSFVVSRQVDRIKSASEALETLVRQHAIPVLEDMETVVRRVA